MAVAHEVEDVDPILDPVKAQIGLIRRAFGTPSVSCGVLHQGEVIFRHAEGLADAEAGRGADSDTVYPIASCTKAFTAATCGVLVREGLLSWDEPVSSILPEFLRTEHAEEVGREATLVDLCSHSTGLAPADHAILGFRDEYYNDDDAQVAIAAHLPIAGGFRGSFHYNNFMYGLVSVAIRRVCGQSAGTVMQDKIFRPLGLDRTCTRAADYPSDGNVAKGYSVLNDGSLLPLGDVKLEDGSPHGGAGCVRSTVNDMLQWAKAVMLAEAANGDDDNKDDPLPDMAFMRSGRIPVRPESSGDDDGEGRDHYGLGWFRHRIPTCGLGAVSPNFMLLPDPPTIGRDSPERLAIGHQGALGGFLASFYTFPETCSAVVVLANSSPSRGDPADLVAQSLCQELFSMTPRVDFAQVAAEVARTARLIWPALVRDWVLTRSGGEAVGLTPPTTDYVGVYRNAGLALQIDVYERSTSGRRVRDPRRSQQPLAFSVNRLARQTAKLRHYRGDTWTFLPNSRDDAARKGMELYMSLPSVLLVFGRDAAGRVSWLDWDFQGGESHDPARFERVC